MSATAGATRHPGRGRSQNDALAAVLPSSLAMAQAFGLLRGFMGLVLLLNGLAKVFEVHSIRLGPYVANLIDRADTRFILKVEANRNARHPLPGIRSLVNDVFLAHYGFWQWVFTAAEVGIGLLLVLGLASRLAALAALLQFAFLAVLYLSNDRWLFEQPLEVLPMLLLVWIPSGRVWGVDGSPLVPARLAGRWPF